MEIYFCFRIPLTFINVTQKKNSLLLLEPQFFNSSKIIVHNKPHNKVHWKQMSQIILKSSLKAKTKNLKNIKQDNSFIYEHIF